MSIKIGGYTFQGPYSYVNTLKNKSGVYAIICDKGNKPIDVGESAEVNDRVENHERKQCWKRNCTGSLKYAVKYTPGVKKPGRMKIEQDIRSKVKLPCGKS